MKRLLVYSSPVVSVADVAVRVLGATYLRRAKRRSDMKTIPGEARSIRDTACGDPNASESHKTCVRANVEAFEGLSIDLLNDEADLVRAQLKAIR